jgi:hypothetical protein
MMKSEYHTGDWKVSAAGVYWFFPFPMFTLPPNRFSESLKKTAS